MAANVRTFEQQEEPWPQGDYRLVEDHPLVRGLRFIQTGTFLNNPAGARGWVNVATGVGPTATRGVGRSYVRASSTYIAQDLGQPANSPLTFAALASRPTVAVTENMALVSIGASTNNRHLLYIADGAVNTYAAMFSGDSGGTTGQAQPTPAPQVTAGRMHAYLGVVRTSSSREVWQDGVLKGTDSTAVSASDANKIAVGAYWTSGAPTAGFYMNGSIPLALAWSRALETREIEAWFRDPYQIVERERIWIPTSAAAAAAGNAPRYMHRTQHGMS